MKSLNRTLSLVLVLVMVLGVFGIAGAAFNDQDKIENTEAVSTMVALNIINGKNGNVFDPAGNVTRAEMAKMICVALNGGKEPVLSTSATPMFSDIGGHWGQKYIEYCTSLGIIAGMGDGTFAPDAAVTGSQAAKMMLVAMNYNAKVFGFEGANWEVNVNVAANKAGLYKDISVDASAAISRDNAAQLIFNGINAPNMVRGWSQNPATGEITETYNLGGDSTSIAVTKFGLKTAVDVIKNVKYNAVAKKYVHTLTTGITVDGTPVNTFSTEAEYSSLLEMKAKILYKENTNGGITVYGAYPDESSVLFSGVLGQLASAEFTANYDAFTLAGTTVKFDSSAFAVPVYAFNGGIVNAAGTPPAGGLPGYATGNPQFAFKLVDTNGDNKADKAIVYPYVVEKVTYVNSATNTATVVNAVTGASSTAIDLEEHIVYDGIAKGDYVKKTAAANTISDTLTYEKIALMEGKVTSEKTENGLHRVMISGIWFVDVKNNMKLGSTYEDIAQVNTFIFDSTEVSSFASADKYAVVTSVGTDAYGKTVAKLLFSDGTTKEVVYANAASFTAAAGALVNFVVDPVTEVYTLSDAVQGGFDGMDTNRAYTYSKGILGTDAISDTAIVFAQVGSGAPTDNSYKVLTGAQLKATQKLLNTNQAIRDFTVKNNSTGFSDVVLAYVQIDANVATGTTQYGYITENVSSTLNAKNQTVSEITFWNGTETVTQICADDYSGDVSKGSIFSYTMNTAGDAMVVSALATLKKSAVTAYDGTNITFKTSDNSALNSSKISDKTTVMYVDSAAVKGVAGAEIRLAATDTTWNAYVIDGADSAAPFTLIVVDTKNAMASQASVSLADDPAQAAVTAAFSSYDTVTVTGDFTATAAFEVPAGKTLVVTGTTTLANAKFEVNGTLKNGVVADTNIGQLEIGAKGTLNITGVAASAAVVGQLEALTTAGAKVTFVAAPTSVAADQWYDTDATGVTANTAFAAGTYTYYAANGIKATSVAGWYNATAVAAVLATP